MAVSFANENSEQGVTESLTRWIQQHPIYEMTKPDLFSSLLDAARSRPTDIDADVQIALGILFNCNGEFEKAIDCFDAALNRRTDVCHASFRTTLFGINLEQLWQTLNSMNDQLKLIKLL